MNRKKESLSKSEQIIASITESVRLGKIVPGQTIPSINITAQKYGVARKTVVRAYEKLKGQGVIESKPKTGFFVINKKPNSKLKVLLVIHSFDGHWEILYNNFYAKVSGYCDIEIFFHHYNIKVLELIINRSVADYDLVIISSFNHPRIRSVVARIPAYKVLLVSRKDRLDDSYNYIIQDFYEGTYKALCEAKNQVRKYQKINLSFPENAGHSETLKQGFLKFCDEFLIENTVVHSFKDVEIKKGEAYFLINDNDLIRVLNVCKVRNWIPGKEVGVLSYNETPLKQVIRDGISVVSCNFEMMANEMASFIKEQKTIHKIIPIQFIERNSL
ncbi:GntR family transcriptional regulator [Prolixibacteraceae bacterium Z1-6]|uniref:GntR family transcriptional regulator n=1 Tax=Draconibacterium aestuarii TaxID=2998507 RepID=A0A9X3F415_9BACT|nr:GntR family transcriptional regulator [Prolixibacteraceae bacterium Z1-6]